MAQEKAHSQECANEIVLSLTWDEWIVKVLDAVFQLFYVSTFSTKSIPYRAFFIF